MSSNETLAALADLESAVVEFRKPSTTPRGNSRMPTWWT
jgi:hypothetical protein